MKGSSLRSRPGSLVCPLCEVDKLNTHGHSSARCDSCGVLVSEATLEALKQLTVLPDALGRHHCPACGSEVVPLDARASLSEPEEHGRAWWAGWMDGHFGELSSFVENPSLARWEDPSERLAYYRGHRAGSEARRTSNSSNTDAREKLFG